MPLELATVASGATKPKKQGREPDLAVGGSHLELLQVVLGSLILGSAARATVA